MMAEGIKVPATLLDVDLGALKMLMKLTTSPLAKD